MSSETELVCAMSDGMKSLQVANDNTNAHEPVVTQPIVIRRKEKRKVNDLSRTCHDNSDNNNNNNTNNKHPHDYTQLDVSEFLHQIGLGHKADVFKQEAVDGSMLEELTLDDMKNDLGFSNLQARKFSKAYEKLKNEYSSTGGNGGSCVTSSSSRSSSWTATMRKTRYLYPLLGLLFPIVMWVLFQNFHLPVLLQGEQTVEEKEAHPFGGTIAANKDISYGLSLFPDEQQTAKGREALPVLKNITGFNHSWRPSHEWLEECILNVSNTTSEVIPFYTPGKWEDYRLGDCIKLCSGCQSTNHSYANSFAELYSSSHCKKKEKKKNNFTFVREMLDTYSGSYPRPAEDELVLHFRLGDVIELSKASVITMLSKGANPAHVANFKSAIKSVNEYLDTISTSGLQKVSIRGGSHKAQRYKKSRVYAGCMKRAIQTAGYVVRMEVDSRNPDADFYYMAFAKKIVVSTGGFSRIVGKMVELGGGEIIGRQF